MKHLSTILLATSATLFAIPVLAESPHDHMAMSNAANQAPLTDGVIKKVSKESNAMVVKHGALPNGMPAMTMEFRVQDVAWLNLKAGQKIRFAVDYLNGAMTITRLEVVK